SALALLPSRTVLAACNMAASKRRFCVPEPSIAAVCGAAAGARALNRSKLGRAIIVSPPFVWDARLSLGRGRRSVGQGGQRVLRHLVHEALFFAVALQL